MNLHAMFPFNLPGPTIWYVVLYVVTLLLHVAFMSYVLAGSVMLGLAGLRGMLGLGERNRQAAASAWSPVTRILKDWMPFVLSAAITAGIAPLLFVQILYQQEFYTANLLSFHRWMSILPVLIVAFYLLYLLKAHRIEGRVVLQGIVSMLVMASMLFVAWSWIENHLLSLDRSAWPGQYEREMMVYTSPAIVPRLAFWVVSAFATGALLISWQIRSGASDVGEQAVTQSGRPLASLAIATIVPAAIGMLPVFLWPLGDKPQATGTMLWAWVSIAGAALAAVAWGAVAWRGVLNPGLLTAASIGTGLFWLGALAVRESARIATIGIETVAARHRDVGTLAGFIVFLVFAVLGIGTIAWVIRSVRRAVAVA
jgi:hypothetical protein